MLAHELGHHVQRLLGIEAQVRQLQSQRTRRRRTSSRSGSSCRPTVSPASGGTRPTRPGGRAGASGARTGDLEEGLNAAAAIGDDRIQRMSTGRVSPDRFTHGSSEQRVTWFRRGFESGTPDACQTFQ